MKFKCAFVVAVALGLAACTTNPVPQGYSGPLAKVTDSVSRRSGSGVDFFYVAKVDGMAIDESLTATRRANYGRGFKMEPMVIERDIPARAATFSITGRTNHAAPIQSFTNTEYKLSGEVNFLPSPNARYVVRGVLQDDYSAVWIEDAQTGTVMGNKVEFKGSTALGILEK